MELKGTNSGLTKLFKLLASDLTDLANTEKFVHIISDLVDNLLFLAIYVIKHQNNLHHLLVFDFESFLLETNLLVYPGPQLK